MMMLCWCRLGAQGARVMWAGADPVADSLEHSGLDEPTKPVGEHVAADAETCLELFETAPSQEGVPDEEQAPALADHL